MKFGDATHWLFCVNGLAFIGVAVARLRGHCELEEWLPLLIVGIADLVLWAPQLCRRR